MGEEGGPSYSVCHNPRFHAGRSLSLSHLKALSPITGTSSPEGAKGARRAGKARSASSWLHLARASFSAALQNCSATLRYCGRRSCRAGIFAARLNYSDVIQISEEVLATLRVTFTVLEDIQRRYELLESLQSGLKADLESAEIGKIFEAVKGSLSELLEIGNDDDNFFTKFLKRTGTSITVGPLVAASALLAVPSAQFQGQLAREQRLTAIDC